jgi:macrolide transport system ATP-binding/permease protein
MNGGQVILADEPTGALDSHSGEEVMAILHQLRDQGHTVIIVTHDPQVAAQAERIIEIHDGELVSNPPPRESRLRRRKKRRHQPAGGNFPAAFVKR